MKAVKIRTRSNAALSESELETLGKYIEAKAWKQGFITGYSVQGGALKIGLFMRSFRINTATIGHNARLGIAAYGWNGESSPKGYKRTDVPTWTQREDFNHLVNAAFDKFKLKANITSGAYTIRTFDLGARRHWPEGGDRAVGWSGNASAEIMTEAEARRFLDSDRLEAEHKAAMKQKRAVAHA